jgi:hypothetical protein
VSGRKLKVWGGTIGGQGHYIVAAPTKKRAVEVLNATLGSFSRYYFDGWWCETGNEIELAVASELGVWRETKRFSGQYERVV